MERDIRAMESRIDSLRTNRDGTERRVDAEVFDRATLMAVYKLFHDGTLETIEFPISTGKEAVVFTAKTADDTISETGWVAVKVYRISNAEFRTLYRYIDGDPRFDKVKKDLRDIIMAWAQKEFKNLMRSHHGGVNVPRPITVHRNVLVMELITEGERIAPVLKNEPPQDFDSFAELLLDEFVTMFREARLVHADLSEYNILVRDEKPVLIDLGQAVVPEHPNSHEFLERDVRNISKYLTRKGFRTEPDELMKRLLEQK